MTTGQRRPVRIASSRTARQVNLRTVLRLLAAREASSRTELARVTGMPPPTISRLVAELIDSGLVAEVGTEASDGGRPLTLLEINRSSRQIVAVDLSRRPIVGTLSDLAGTEIARRTAGAVGTAGEQLVDTLGELVSGLASQATAPVAGVGIATPGLVSPDGVVLQAANLDWHKLPLGDLITKRTALPVWVGNDADAAAVVEYGARASDRESLAVVLIAAGVGAGLVFGGRLHAGARAAAGEIGHLVVEPGGSPCSCGNFGCLETVVSVPALVRRAASTAGAAPDDLPRDVTALRQQLGDQPVLDALRNAGAHLGAALAHLVTIVDVTEIVLSIELNGAGDEFLAVVRTTLAERLLPDVGEHVDVRLTEFGSDLVLQGARALVLANALGMVRT